MKPVICAQVDKWTTLKEFKVESTHVDKHHIGSASPR